MNSKYIEDLNKNLDNLIINMQLKDKFIIIFGANKPAEKAILYLNSKNISVDAIIDNDKNKLGKKMLGVKIYTPELLLAKFKKNAAILIASQYYKEMKKQLENMNYKEDVNIFEIIKYKYYTIEEKCFYDKISDVFEGYKILEQIQKKYKKDTIILICPYRGIGDVYFICSYIKEYLKEKQISDYVLTVIGNTCRRVAYMFEIENIEMLEQSETDSLIDIYRMIKNGKEIIKVLSHNYVHTDILDKFEVSNKLSWGELFRDCIMEIDEIKCKTKPKSFFRKDYIKDLFNSNNLMKGRTAILSPYANTIIRLEDGFWEKIVKQLTEKGYSVCTNSIGDEEPAIEGSIPLKFQLEDAISVVEYAGIFIGIRSGFCDLISSARAKKIVFYPNEKDLFFSIKKMGLAEDVLELQIHEELDINNELEKIDVNYNSLEDIVYGV